MKEARPEPCLTTREIADLAKLHPATVVKMFRDRPGVVKLGTRRVGLRIPLSVFQAWWNERTAVQ